MQVSSDTLFHFTTSLKNLENILSKKFQLAYCKEKFTLDYETHESYFPMISFCDIPLHLTKHQILKYGSYAIGMNKEWGIKNKLNPVLYLETDSLVSKDIQDTLDSMVKLLSAVTEITERVHITIKEAGESIQKTTSLIQGERNPIEKNKLDNELVNKLKEVSHSLDPLKNHIELIKHSRASALSHNNIFRYIKNYRGTLIRQDRITKNYRFYDEREWRYVPAIKDKRVQASLSEEQYKEYRGKGISKPLIDSIILNFTSEDIKYLIVKSSKDVSKLIRLIKKLNNLTKNPNDADILTTKILTIEQLNNDF